MDAHFTVSICEEDFDVGSLQRELLSGGAAEGAVATFTGYVRSDNDARQVGGLRLEHYPGMTEKSIQGILQEAQQRWPLLAGSVAHRVGNLAPGDHIVWVGIASAHRDAAFAACEFVMDYLKTRAPFWKKESGPQGEHWVEARVSDDDRARRWGQQ